MNRCASRGIGQRFVFAHGRKRPLKTRHKKGAIGLRHAKDHSFKIRKIEIREEK